MIDIAAIRRDNPMPEVAGKIVALNYAGGEWVASCPFHVDRSPSFTIYLGRDDIWRAHCFGCGWHGDVLDFVQRAYDVSLHEAARRLVAGDVPRLDVPTVSPRPFSQSDKRARAIWHRAIPVIGTLGESYLRFRGLQPPYPDAVRFAFLPCDDQAKVPCLVWAVRDVAGNVIGIQRIWLANDGRGKANVAKPKRSLGNVKGGAIRLGDPDTARVLAVCEGPEDGLSILASLNIPVWVAAGASMLSAMQFPQEVQTIVIGADNDPQGHAAAEMAARAFAQRGLCVRIIYPLDCFKDFNEELQGGVHAH